MPLSTTLASESLPSLPSLTTVEVVWPLPSIIVTVCVPLPLSTTLASAFLPSAPVAPVSPFAPAAPVAPSFTTVVVVLPLPSTIVTV